MNTRLVELGRKFADCKARHEKIEDELKVVAKEWVDVENDLLAAMIDEGVNSINIEGVGNLGLRTRNILSVNAANKEKFYAYLTQSGNGSLLKLDVNPKTLTAFLSGHLEKLIAEKQESAGLDPVDARNEALEFLNKQGASYFVKRDISLRKA